MQPKINKELTARHEPLWKLQTITIFFQNSILDFSIVQQNEKRSIYFFMQIDILFLKHK